MTNKVTRGNGLMEVFLSKKRAKIVNSFIPNKLRKGRILDIGCGSFPHFLINTKFNEKYGIDPHVKVEDTSSTIKLSKDSINCAAKLEFKDNFFDVITMIAVVEHLDKKEAFPSFKEIKRILKPKGRFILTTPLVWSEFMLTIMSKLKLVSKEELSDHKYLYTPKSLIKLLTKAGFKKGNIHFKYFEFFLNFCAYVDNE